MYRDVNEEQPGGDKVAIISMVLKDVATNFRRIYPAARSHTKDCVLCVGFFGNSPLPAM